MGQVSGIDSLCLQKALGTRLKIFTKRNCTLKGLMLLLLRFKYIRRNFSDVGLANTDISRYMVSAAKVVLVAQGREKPVRQDLALALSCVGLWF